MSVHVRNLSHVYSPGMPGEQKALDDVSFDIYDGETAAVIGHTGSGKSTLLQHLNGLLKPTSGAITVEERLRSSLRTKESMTFFSRSARASFSFNSACLTIIRNGIIRCA